VYPLRLSQSVGLLEDSHLEVRDPVESGNTEHTVKLSVEVTAAEQQKLAEEARRLNVSAEELAAAAVHDLLGQRDADFERAATRVLEKNRELYRRLA
jgi:hypothetical protein